PRPRRARWSPVRRSAAATARSCTSRCGRRWTATSTTSTRRGSPSAISPAAATCTFSPRSAISWSANSPPSSCAAGWPPWPPPRRARANKPQYRAEPTTKEEIRQRRASANRVLTMLKAALNHANDEGHVANRDAWGRRLAPFEKVEVARVRYLTVVEAERLINACASEFRPLVRAGLETGCRYGELIRLTVADYNPDAGTLAIRQSKSGKPRHVVLTEEGAAFFRRHCAGRSGHESMFRHGDGGAWQKSEQARPMAEACARAKIKPAISFHI